MLFEHRGVEAVLIHYYILEYENNGYPCETFILCDCLGVSATFSLFKLDLLPHKMAKATNLFLM